MSLRRAPEWYEQYQKRMARKPATEIVGNCELVKITSGVKTGKPGAVRPALERSDPDPCQRGVPRLDRKATAGPLTQCREGGAVNQPVRVPSSLSLRTTATSSAAPLYPLVRKCRELRILEPVPEYRFHPTRKFRFDYAWPMQMLACEIEGGLWTQGRHSRGKGAIADLEKYSEAAILGWRLIYATPQELDNGVCLDRVIRALTDRDAA